MAHELTQTSGPLRRVADVDLADIAEALGDSGDETAWWDDSSTGRVEVRPSTRSEFSVDEEDDPRDRDLIEIACEGSRAAYRDMVAFVAAIGDRGVGIRLLRELEGRGAFRRFRNVVIDLPELNEMWSTYSRARDECRAIHWLLSHGRIEQAEAESQLIALAEIVQVVVTEVGGRSDLEVDDCDVIERWLDVRAAIDSGRYVTLVRDGRRWAVIAPE